MSEEQLQLDIPYDPFTASASAVDTFELCQRKWGWNALDGIKGPSNKYAEFGTKTHNHLERWLMNGHPPPSTTAEGKLAQKMLVHLPPPQKVDPSHVELELSMRLGGVYFLGKIDLFMPLLLLPTIYDHKTTSDFKWALTPEEMCSDVQATLYASYAMLKTHSKSVRVQWTYGERKSQKTLPVVQELCGADIRDRLTQTIETARQMRDLSANEKLTALDLPYNAMACEAYGGCPYIEQCNLSESERIEAIMGQSFEERLKARGDKAAKANPPKDVKKPAEKPAEKKEATAGENALMKRMRERMEAQKAAEQEEQDPDNTTTEETDTETEEPKKKRGRGRPKKEKSEEQTPEPAVVESDLISLTKAFPSEEMLVKRQPLTPPEIWVAIVSSALAGGADSRKAIEAASAAVIEFGVLFSSEE